VYTRQEDHDKFLNALNRAVRVYYGFGRRRERSARRPFEFRTTNPNVYCSSKNVNSGARRFTVLFVIVKLTRDNNIDFIPSETKTMFTIEYVVDRRFSAENPLRCAVRKLKKKPPPPPVVKTFKTFRGRIGCFDGCHLKKKKTTTFSMSKKNAL